MIRISAVFIFVLFSTAALAEVVVYDGNNTYLGVLMSGDRPSVFNEKYGIFFTITHDGILSSSAIMFEKQNCEGKSYGWKDSFDSITYTQNDGHIYKNTGTASTVSVQSYKQESTSGVFVCQNMNITYTFAEYVIATDFPFSLPFKMPLSVKYSSRAAVIPLLSN